MIFFWKAWLEDEVKFFKILYTSCYPRLKHFDLRIFSISLDPHIYVNTLSLK